MSAPNAAKYCGNPILSVQLGWSCCCLLLCGDNIVKLFLVENYVSLCFVQRGFEASICQLGQGKPPVSS